MAYIGLTLVTIIAVVAYFIPYDWVDQLYPQYALSQMRNVIHIDKFDLLVVFVFCKAVEYSLSPLRLLLFIRPPQDEGSEEP